MGDERFFIRASQDHTGQWWLYDAQVPYGISWEDALHLRDILSSYVQLGPERIAAHEATARAEYYENKDIPMPAPSGRLPVPGYVYLLKEVNGDHYKIGCTGNPDNRMYAFEVKLPFKVEYTALIRTRDMYALEKQLHERFADNRVAGEWFDLSPQDVQYITSIRGYQ